MLNHPAIDRTFHALADPTRRAIIERLCLRPATVSDLARPFEITLAAVVQHLQVLEKAGIVRTEKIGRTRTCAIEHAGLRTVEDWVAERKAHWESRFDRLDVLLAEESAAEDTDKGTGP